MRLFWLLLGSIDRINAQLDLRQTRLIGLANAEEETHRAVIDSLVRELGDIGKTGKEDELDREGLMALKSLAG